MSTRDDVRDQTDEIRRAGLVGRRLPPGHLRTAGKAAYGEAWQSELARDLGVTDRTVRRWASGATRPSLSTAVDLLEILDRRAAGIRQAKAMLRREIKEDGDGG